MTETIVAGNSGPGGGFPTPTHDLGSLAVQSLVMDEIARDADRRFNTFHRGLFCKLPDHEEYVFGDRPVTELLVWMREHWGCGEPPEPEQEEQEPEPEETR